MMNECFPQDQERKVEMPAFAACIQHSTGSSSQEQLVKEKKKASKFKKEIRYLCLQVI